MTDKPKVSTVLKEVDALFASDANFTHGYLALRPSTEKFAPMRKLINGKEVKLENTTPNDPAATCYCFLGAVARVLSTYGIYPDEPLKIASWYDVVPVYMGEYITCGYVRKGYHTHDEAVAVAKEAVETASPSVAYGINDNSDFDELKRDITCAIELAEKEEANDEHQG